MKPKIDAVALKRSLQQKAQAKLARLSDQEQLELLRRKYGPLMGRNVSNSFRANLDKPRVAGRK